MAGHRLPAATQSGLNTAGFELAGRSWVPHRSSISTTPPVSATWRKTPRGHALALSFRQFSVQEDWGVGLFLPDVQRAGVFALDQVPAITNGRHDMRYGEFYQLRPGPRRLYFTGPEARGQVVITRLDTIHNIVAGTFWMRPQLGGDTSTVSLVGGRFDVLLTR